MNEFNSFIMRFNNCVCVHIIQVLFCLSYKVRRPMPKVITSMEITASKANPLDNIFIYVKCLANGFPAIKLII